MIADFRSVTSHLIKYSPRSESADAALSDVSNDLATPVVSRGPDVIGVVGSRIHVRRLRHMRGVIRHALWAVGDPVCAR